MKARDAGVNRHRLMQRGEIAEADDGTWIAADGVVVDAVENAHGAIAAAREEESVELCRVQVSVELFDALVVGAGEVSAMAVREVFGERDARAARLEILLRLLDAIGFGRR